MSPNLIWASLQKSYYGGWKFQRALFVSWTAGGSIVSVLISCGVEIKFCSKTEHLNYNWPRSWCKIVLISLHLWAGVGTEGSFGRASGGNASEPGLHSEDWPGTKKKSLQEWNPQHVLSIWIKTNKNSFIKRNPPPPHTHTVRKQVNRASLPQTLAPRRWMLGFSCTALPVEPHSCRTLGCTWSTSSDTALSSGKYLQPEHARPCRHQSKTDYICAGRVNVLFIYSFWMYHLETLCSSSLSKSRLSS